jgi:membrane protein
MAAGTSISGFLRRDIWRVRRKGLPPSRSLLIGVLRVPLLAFRKLFEDQCLLRASSLTYFSLLSLVPTVAMLLAIAKGFRFQEKLEVLLLEQVGGQREVISRIVEFSQRLLDTATDGLVAGIGLLILLYTIVKILSSIEEAFNAIWQVERGRTIGRKISDYFSLMLLSPIIFFFSSSLTVFVSGEAELAVRGIGFLAPVGPLILSSLQLLQVVVLWVFFSFLYILIPNARVRLSSGVLGGVIAGTVFQVFQWGYIEFQIGVSKYNAIYGSFAALPLFFVWLQFSWIIVLFGAEIAFAHQNADAFEFEEEYRSMNSAGRRLLSLRILHVLVKEFLGEHPPPNAGRVSRITEVPLRVVRQVLDELVASGLVSEVRIRGENGPGFQPSRDPELLTIRYAIQAMEEKGSSWLPGGASREQEEIRNSLRSLAELIERSPANLRLKDI